MEQKIGSLSTSPKLTSGWTKGKKKKLRKKERTQNTKIWNETEDITTNSTGKKKNYKSMMKNYILINLIT